MTQPIDPFGRDRWDPALDDDPFLRSPSTTARPAAKPAREQPALPDIDTALLARATGKSGADARAAAASNVRADAAGGPRSPVQARLDGLLAASTLTLHTPEGDATVSVGFWMGADYDNLAGGRAADEARDAAVAAAHLSPQDRQSIAIGKPSPQAVIRVAELLVAQGRLPPARPGVTLADRVRQMMAEHRLGIDCAAYVRAALVAIHGTAWDRAHFPKGGADAQTLSNLKTHGFLGIEENDLRPGDVISLEPTEKEMQTYGIQAVGHRVIVYEQHQASRDELAALARSGDARLAQAAAGGRVRVLQVDSSWGAGGVPSCGGVDRRTWLHDESNHLWFWRDDAGSWRASTLPYGHPLEGHLHGGTGMYRAETP